LKGIAVGGIGSEAGIGFLLRLASGQGGSRLTVALKPIAGLAISGHSISKRISSPSRVAIASNGAGYATSAAPPPHLPSTKNRFLSSSHIRRMPERLKHPITPINPSSIPDNPECLNA